VKPGDFFYIPAGTLHAIGAGVRLAEVQQNSDTTYRVYDYNRLQNGKPRPLHIEQAMAVTDPVPYRRLEQRSDALVRNEFFTLREQGGPQGFSGRAGDDSFVSLVLIDADEQGCELTCNGETLTMHKNDSVFIPAGAGEYRVAGRCAALTANL